MRLLKQACNPGRRRHRWDHAVDRHRHHDLRRPIVRRGNPQSRLPRNEGRASVHDSVQHDGMDWHTRDHGGPRDAAPDPDGPTWSHRDRSQQWTLQPTLTVTRPPTSWSIGPTLEAARAMWVTIHWRDYFPWATKAASGMPAARKRTPCGWGSCTRPAANPTGRIARTTLRRLYVLRRQQVTW